MEHGETFLPASQDSVPFAKAKTSSVFWTAWKTPRGMIRL
jgi:hypothetical protein